MACFGTSLAGGNFCEIVPVGSGGGIFARRRVVESGAEGMKEARWEKMRGVRGERADRARRGVRAVKGLVTRHLLILT